MGWSNKLSMTCTSRCFLRFSDYQLRDVGLTRASLRALLKRPADCDLMWELERQHVVANADSVREMASTPAEPTSSPHQHYGTATLRQERC